MNRNSVFLVVVALGAAAGCGKTETPAPPPAAAPAKAAATVCKHDVLDADCPFCHPDLIQKLGFCKEHGVSEAECWICKPSLVAAYKAMNDWCAGHGLPESQCGACNPGKGEAHAKAIAAGRAAPLPPGEIAVVPDPDAPRSGRAPSATCATEKVRVQLASPEVAKSAGFQYATIGKRKVVETLSVNAEIAFVPSGYAKITARIAGPIREVRHDLGETVAAGEVLAVVQAPELASAKAEVLRAKEIVDLRRRNLDREKGLLERSLATQREVVAAESELAVAEVELSATKQRLQGLGVAESDVANVVATKDTSSTLPVVALVAGQIVERDAIVGEVVDTSRTLFAVADTSTVWAMLDVREADASRVALGQTAVLQFGGRSGERVAGKVSWISPRVEPSTRTVKVRVALPNPDGALRAGAFGTAELHLRQGEPMPAVPKSAVQWEGCCNVAFVRMSDQVFVPRKLRLGADLGDHFAVISGLADGDVVVTEGSFLLKTEIRRESIGAGCCGEN
jgi:cobalt-zinc-cadmium efflux system membrane fusion protein